MAVSDNQPTNLNYLSPLGFRFSVKKLPNVNYFCQSVTLPSIAMNAIDVPSPFGLLPKPGDRLVFSPLAIQFRVDEDLKNYMEIQDWMTGLGHPDSLAQTRELSETSPAPIRRVGSAASFVSDGTLTIQTSHKNSSINVFFYDLFPIDITELLFDSTVTDVDYLQATITFRYRKYLIERI